MAGIGSDLEGRFTITYCPGHLSRAEIEGVGFRYGDLPTMMQRYDPAKLQDGWNRLRSGGTLHDHLLPRPFEPGRDRRRRLPLRRPPHDDAALRSGQVARWLESAPIWRDASRSPTAQAI